jgi:hypothetical protein
MGFIDRARVVRGTLIVLPLAVAGVLTGVAQADGGAQLTPAGQAETPGLTFTLDKPSYAAGDQVTITWSGLPSGALGEVWIDPASTPADGTKPASDSGFLSTSSGTTTIAGPKTGGSYQVRVAWLGKSPPQVVATDDVDFAGPAGTPAPPTGGGDATPPATDPGTGGGSTTTPPTTTTPPVSHGHASHPADGHYGCYTSGVGGSLIRSSIQSVTIKSSSKYTAVGTTGNYKFAKPTQKLTIKSGYLKGAVARYQASPKKLLEFKRSENLRHGKPWIDDTNTFCYLGRK